MKPALQLSHATPVNTWVQVMGKKKKKNMRTGQGVCQEHYTFLCSKQKCAMRGKLGWRQKLLCGGIKQAKQADADLQSLPVEWSGRREGKVSGMMLGQVLPKQFAF